VTAVRNFLRYIGGALSLAVGSSIINNALVSRAHSIGLADNLLHEVTSDPTLISKATFNVTTKVREELLEGYNHGFRVMFLLNASLAAFAAVVAFVLIKHKELIRADDAERKAEARDRVEAEMRAIKDQDIMEDGRKLATARNDSASKGEMATRRPPVNSG